MITRYYQYHERSPALDEFIDRVNELRYRYYASDLMDKLMDSEDFDLEQEVRKAIAICKLANIPVQQHFACVYRQSGREVLRDWKLSELACSFIIVSHDPKSEEVKSLQHIFISNLGL